jgi:hypothetical protein
MYLVGVIRRPGLQQQHTRGRVLGKARRQDAAGAAGPNDDIVVHGHLPNTVRISRDTLLAGGRPETLGEWTQIRWP